MEWIDTLDRLPAHGKRVLLLSRSSGVRVGSRIAPTCRWELDGRWRTMDHDDVTYWCEIPSPTPGASALCGGTGVAK